MQSQAQLLQWRSKVASSTKEWAATTAALRSQVAATQRHCRELRTAMACFQAQDAMSLKHLCIQRSVVLGPLGVQEGTMPLSVSKCRFDCNLLVPDVTAQLLSLCLHSNIAKRHLQQQLEVSLHVLKLSTLAENLRTHEVSSSR